MTFHAGIHFGAGIIMVLASFVKKYSEACLLFLTLVAIIVRPVSMCQGQFMIIFHQLLVGVIIIISVNSLGFFISETQF